MDFITSQPAVSHPVVKTEAAHLQRLLPEYAANTDVVLYTTDGGVETELPAHAEVLSKHSDVLSEMVTACKEPRIHMSGDLLSELKAMLTIMYRPGSVEAMTSCQLLSALVVTHKYGIKQAMSEVESRLVANVKHAAHSSYTDHDTVDNIISYAAAGEKFELRNLRAYSEAYIAVNLDQLGGRDLPLSRHSLCRIATALAKRFKAARADIDSLVPALESSIDRHAEYDCPACSGHIYFQKFGKRRQGIRCSEKWCRWMPLQTEVQHHARMTSCSNKPHIIDSKECFGDLLLLLSE